MLDHEGHLNNLRNQITANLERNSSKSKKKSDFFKIFKGKKEQLEQMKREHKLPVKETFALNTKKKLAIVDLLYLLDWITLNSEQVAVGKGDSLEVKLSYVLLNECVVQQNQSNKRSLKNQNIFSLESFENNQNFEGVKFHGSLVQKKNNSNIRSKGYSGFFSKTKKIFSP